MILSPLQSTPACACGQPATASAAPIFARCGRVHGLTGNVPTADSPDNMTQSVPSMTAFATSVASARVGRTLEVLDSSAWVAVITGLPCWLSPLCERNSPPPTRQRTSLSWTVVTSSRMMASFKNSVLPGHRASGRVRKLTEARLVSPTRSAVVSVKICPGTS
jgi:hypothetical protein